MSKVVSKWYNFSCILFFKKSCDVDMTSPYNRSRFGLERLMY